MIPSVFRELPRHERIELIAHMREVQLREAHANHESRIVNEQFAEAEAKSRRGS